MFGPTFIFAFMILIFVFRHMPYLQARQLDEIYLFAACRSLLVTNKPMPSSPKEAGGWRRSRATRSASTPCTRTSTCAKNWQILQFFAIFFCKFCTFLAGSFSAVSNRNFARKYICVRRHFSSSTKFAYFCTTAISNFGKICLKISN